MRWFVIANPGSGQGAGVVESTRRALEAHGIEHELSVSTNDAHVSDLVQGARNRGHHRFAAAGGDGTAHLVLNALMSEPWADPPVLGILPAGSGSDFIRTFALPRTIEAAAAHLATDAVYRTDVGLIEGSFGSRYFLNVADAGIAAALIPAAGRVPRLLGGARYPAAFWLTLPRFRAGEVVVRVGNRTFEGAAINVVIANGQFFGGGMNIAPRATVMDGAFDVQVFRGPRRQAFTVMPRVVRGTHLGHPGVRRFSGPEVTVECPGEWPIEADGESIGTGPITAHVVAGAIDFKI